MATFLPVAGAQGGWGTSPAVVHGVALQAADVDGVVDHIPAAARLAGMLADVGAGHGEGIVLADQPHRVGAASLAYQGHIAGNVHAGGTQGHAGHRQLQARQTAVVQDVLLVVVPEALQPVQHQSGGVAPDGAVGGVHDGPGGFLDNGQGAHVAVPSSTVAISLLSCPRPMRQGTHLPQDWAWHSCRNDQGHIHRAQPRRAGGDAPLHVAVEIVHHGLGAAGVLMSSLLKRGHSFRLRCSVKRMSARPRGQFVCYSQE